MAQKETSSKSRRWLGLSGAAVLVANLVLTGTTIAFQQEGEVNHALGIEGGDASYGGTEFSADGTLSDASYEKYIEAAYQFCEQEEEEGSVLLYNRNNALPLSESERNVTVFGRGSIDPVFRSTAGGSSTNPDYQKTPVDALQDAGFNVNQTVLDAYASAEAPKERSVSSVGEYDPALFTGSVTDSFASYGDVAFVTLSRFATEGNDLAMVNDEGKRMLELDDNEKAIFQKIKDSGKFKKTVVLLNSVFAMEMDWLDEYNVDAVLWVGNPGFYGMPGAIRVVTGEVNPSGHTTATFAANSLSAPSAENFGLHAYNYGSKTPRAAGDSFVSYNEGIYVGYRYYETRYEDTILGQGNADSAVGTKASTDGWNYAEEVCFPFGYGLSYTTFEQTLDNLNVDLENETVTANVTVKNTGSVAGKDVVQLYVSLPYTDYDKEHGVEKAAIQLLDYGKTAELAPGASETVTITADMQNMASWDSTADNAVGTKGCYILDAGDYWFTIGNGAHEAVNNVLAAEGQSVDGSADKAKSWTLDSFDDTTFATTKNGTAVENQLADMDINSWLPGTATYMTRSDWEGTFPKTYKNLTASDEMLDILDNDIYEINANGDPSTVTFGADNGLTLADLKGVTDLDDERWSLLMDQLTLEEGMIRLGLGGTSTKAIESIMSPETIQNDGPNGIYSYPLGQYANTDKAGTDPCAVDANDPNLAYKFGTMVNETVIAQTFNKDLANEYGKICGNYSLWSNLTIFWGCGTNLHRSPYNARNHEYYSEDAVLTSGQAVAFISGGKEYGVIIAPKHLAFNDTEINRTGVSVFMTEQQARENELRGTQAAIAHTGLLKNILRGEWGFKGLESQDFIMNPNYAVLKEYALNGGTMTTFTGENTMAAVSEKFAYWTTENVGQDTELMSAIKQAMTWQAYALANSNALDGMASSTRLVSVRTWYDNALVAVQVVFAALTVLAAAMYVLNDRKSKKQ